MSLPIEIIRSHLAGANEPFNSGAQSRDFKRFEQRLRLPLPTSVRAAYSIMNGSDGYTTLDLGWIRLWPLDEWRLVESEFDSIYPTLRSPWVLFADHALDAFSYALHLHSRTQDAQVCLVDSPPVPVAESFDEFLQLVVTDSSLLFGPAA